MSKIKVTYKELVNMRDALQGLSALNLPIPYELAKNLRRVKSALKEPEELLDTLRSNYVDKDENGGAIFYGVNKDDKFTKYIPENRNEFNPDTPLLTLISDKSKLKEYQEKEKEFNKDEFEVDFHEIKMSKLKDYLQKDGIPGNLFEPLVDIIFIDDIDTK